MRWTAKFLAVAGVITVAAGASNAQLTNGNFEADTAPTSQTATGWAAGGFGTVPGLGGVRNDGFSISGNYYYLNEGPGYPVGLSQLIAIPAPTGITISGQYASRDFNGGSADPSRNSFIVRVLDAGGTNTLYEQAFGTTALGDWTSFSVTTSTINASSVRVMFIGQGNGFDDDFMIDNVAAGAAIPEPGSVALIALALVPGIALLRRRRTQP